MFFFVPHLSLPTPGGPKNIQKINGVTWVAQKKNGPKIFHGCSLGGLFSPYFFGSGLKLRQMIQLGDWGPDLVGEIGRDAVGRGVKSWLANLPPP